MSSDSSTPSGVPATGALWEAGVRLQSALTQAALGVYRTRMELERLYGTQLSFDDVDWALESLRPVDDSWAN